MPSCQHCRFEFPAHQTPTSTCPRCGQALAESEVGQDWTSIARLTNLAEVGYFADALETRGMPTKVRQHNEYSALDGTWRSTFILQVPQTDGVAAAELIEHELAQSADEAEDWDLARAAGDSGPPSFPAAPWKSLAMVLVASGLAYCAGHSGADQLPPRLQPSLWQALRESSSPLVTNGPPGTPRQRISFDPATGSILLEDDFDGDGRFDRLRQFQEGRLVRELAR